MIEYIHYLEQVDTNVFLFFNGLHNSFWDSFMLLYSGRFVWVPLYVSFLYVMFKNYSWKSCLSCLLVITLLVTLCDQTASGLLKPMVGRFRPSNLDSPIAPLVHIVDNYRGGKYGFPSSHSANSWGMTFFAMYLVRNKKLTSFLISWAVVMTYTRIYLGVHYPGDLLVGILIGFIMATICYYGFEHFGKKYADSFKSDDSRTIKFSSIPFIVGIGTAMVLLLISVIHLI